MAAEQSSPTRRKRVYDFYGDAMGQVFTEDGSVIRPKDYHVRRGKGHAKPRKRIRRGKVSDGR